LLRKGIVKAMQILLLPFLLLPLGSNKLLLSHLINLIFKKRIRYWLYAIFIGC